MTLPIADMPTIAIVFIQETLPLETLSALAKSADVIGSKIIDTTNSLMVASTGKKISDNLFNKLKKADFSSRNTQLAVLKTITAVALTTLAFQIIFPIIGEKIVETLIISAFTSLALRYAIEAKSTN